VTFLGHCFRHKRQPVTKLLSLPVVERLSLRRLQGHRDVPTVSAQAARQHLEHLGLQLGELVAGRLGSRSFSGHPHRWGEGWFFEIRDGGLNWCFRRDDKAAIDCRIKFLHDIFVRVRVKQPLAILDNMQEALADSMAGPRLSLLND